MYGGRKMTRNFNQYRPVFIMEKDWAKKEMLKAEKAAKWKKQVYEASSKFKDIKTHEEFANAAMKINAFPMVFANLSDKKKETLFECELFDGNEAWIGPDNIGVYRYFTGDSYDEAVGFTIIDLLLCFQDIPVKGYTPQSQYVIRELADLLKASYEDINWERREKEKYIEDKRMLTLFQNQEFQKKYPLVFKKLKPYQDVLEKMLEQGKKYIDLTRKDENNYSYFTFFHSQSGVSISRCNNAQRRLNELGLLFVEVQLVTIYSKETKKNEDILAKCFSFPLFTEELFNQIEKGL